MRHGILKSVLGVSLGVVFAAGAQAELQNISTNALQSQNTETVGCSIVGAGGLSFNGGWKQLVILSEGKAGDSDPTIVVKTSDGKVFSNDNWRSTVYFNGVADGVDDIAGWLGRGAGRETDSGMVIQATPGLALCAYSRENSGGDALRPVSISVTDVTFRVQEAQSFEVDVPGGVIPAGIASRRR